MSTSRGQKHSRPSSGSSTSSTPEKQDEKKLKTAETLEEEHVMDDQSNDGEDDPGNDSVFKGMFDETNISEALMTMLKGEKLKSLIMGYIDNAVAVLKQELTVKFEKRFEQIESELFDLQQAKDAAKHETEEIMDRLDYITSGVDEAHRLIEELEMYARRNAIRIYGVPENKSGGEENCVQVATKLFDEKLGLKITAEEISRAHRVGKPAKPPRDPRIVQKPRPIILKFLRHDRKAEVIRERRKLKGTNIVIREDLTALRNGLVTI